MRLPRMWVGILAVTVLVFASASTAQAYDWLIAKEDFTSLGITKESTSIAGSSFELVVPTLKLTIKCTSESGTGEITEGGKSSASVTLKGCSVVESKSCVPKSPGQAAGTMTAKVTTKYFEKEVGGVMKYYDEFSPLMTIEFGEECAIAETSEVHGTTAAEVPKLGEEPVKRPQKFSEAIAKSAELTSLAFGKRQAFLGGEDTLALSGANAGQPPGMTPVAILPAAFNFGGTARPLTVTVENIANNKIRLKNLEIQSGPFTLTEATPPCKTRVLTVNGATKTCSFTITCNTAGMQGIFIVEVEELNAAGGVIGMGGRGRRMMC